MLFDRGVLCNPSPEMVSEVGGNKTKVRKLKQKELCGNAIAHGSNFTNF